MATEKARIVRLVNKGSKFESMWDGKEVAIAKGKHIDVPLGLAEHFQSQSEHLEIEDVPAEEAEARTPANPLDEGDRGGQFEELN